MLEYQSPKRHVKFGLANGPLRPIDGHGHSSFREHAKLARIVTNGSGVFVWRNILRDHINRRGNSPECPIERFWQFLIFRSGHHVMCLSFILRYVFQFGSQQEHDALAFLHDLAQGLILLCFCSSRWAVIDAIKVKLPSLVLSQLARGVMDIRIQT